MPDFQIALGDDRLEGAKAIAAFVYPDRDPDDAHWQVRHLIRKRLIPAGKLGGTVVGSKRLIAAALARAVGGEAA